ncbi:MAG: SIS domain-containing protein [Anaerolineae bacterium]|nr:SIS domain-containing protein [Anaerolineae bacterium]
MSSFATELEEQPDALHRLLDAVESDLHAVGPLAAQLRAGRFRRVILTGMGGSYCAVYPASLYLLSHGVTALPLPAGELFHHAPAALDPDTLLIAVSQSGASVETRRAVEEGPRPGAIIGVTNDPDSPIARASDVIIPLRAGYEATVSSKTYTSSLAAMHLLARVLLGEPPEPHISALRRTADTLREALPVWQAAAREMVEKLDGVQTRIFLGRGPSFASAMAGALVTKECAKVPTEGMNGAEYRHGPVEISGPDVALVIFGGPAHTRANARRLAADMAGLGARVVFLGAPAVDAPGVLNVAVDSPDDWLLPILEIVPAQCFAAALAAHRGLQVGHFYHGKKITVEE